MLFAAGIQIIRVGLKSSDLISNSGKIRGQTFHPAFRQLVEGAIAREKMEALLREALPELSDPSREVTFLSNEKWFSNLVGHQRRNRTYFDSAFPDLKFSYRAGDFPDGVIAIAVAGSPRLVVK